jgi:hypothetical protein
VSHRAGALLTVLLVAGCASTDATAPQFAGVAGVQEVDLRWQPAPGMRLVQRVTTEMEVSGPLTRPLPDAQKKQRIALVRTTEVAAVAPDHFDVRFAQDDVTVPATLRFSRAWEPLTVTPDAAAGASGVNATALEATMRALGEPLTRAAHVFRRWKVGDTQPFEVRLAAIPGASGNANGTMTFRRVVVVDGRQAAEFDWRSRAEFIFIGEPGRGVPGRMDLAGHEWRDLATGAQLRLNARGEAQFIRQGEATKVQYRTEEILDVAASRLD